MLDGFNQPYGVLIDVRQVHRIEPEALEVLLGGQHLPHGLLVTRAIIVVDSRTLPPSDFGAMEPGPDDKMLFLDAAQDPFWQGKAIAVLKAARPAVEGSP